MGVIVVVVVVMAAAAAAAAVVPNLLALARPDRGEVRSRDRNHGALIN